MLLFRLVLRGASVWSFILHTEFSVIKVSRLASTVSASSSDTATSSSRDGIDRGTSVASDIVSSNSLSSATSIGST